ncbi:MAG: glycogen/starch/alpha-glucan phosphorylase [Betaproteobacteria bacterium]|nr:MAG: glycogen/starch/alpha-glucan phosphorylase [Betaproteobacteria bacterium]
MSDIAERALHTRTARSVEAIQRAFLDNLFYIIGVRPEEASAMDHYLALAYTLRERLLARFIAARERDTQGDGRTLAYLSAEFLVGPQLGNNILSLDVWENTWSHTQEAMNNLGLDLEVIMATEPEPGLGNGGLGRLAACYMDSLATLEIPAIGYGIRYEYGIFEQKIHNGWQVEVADAWLRHGNPWEIPNLQRRYPVGFEGHTETYNDQAGLRVRWVPKTLIYGVAYDTPVLGYGVTHVNLLRLWRAEARETFDLQAFNHGDYYGAVDAMVNAENITKVLYPNDDPEAGKILRLQQQYFFVSCSLQDMIRRALSSEQGLTHFSDRFVVQLNDTHPAIAIAELMRLLVDEHGMNWSEAWPLTRKTFAYTNHTLLPEALETWSLPLFARLLPRHLEIIYQINTRFLDEVIAYFGHDHRHLHALSIIDEHGEKRIRMANLACVGSFSINGVARLHSDLLTRTVLKEFHQLWPQRFNNKTNGVTQRRFIALANRPLAQLISQKIGNAWLRNLDQLQQLETLADDPEFQAQWQQVKLTGKIRLANHIQRELGIRIDPNSLFDIHAKRIHEYKRQHLNILHVISLYLRLKEDPNLILPARTFIFAGKAAPSYFMAKLIIKLINAVADTINHDPLMEDRLKVVFVPDLNVKQGQLLYPAADISEQISLAGMEASGTGNMKFAMNGALTLGTLDGANVEMREAVGAENFFLFGLRVDEVMHYPRHHSRHLIEQQPRLHAALNAIASGQFSPFDPGIFAPLLDNLWNHDPYLVCADFASYTNAQTRIAQHYQDPALWTRTAILNVARMGYFSSDRAIQEYCTEIWKIGPAEPPCPVF